MTLLTAKPLWAVATLCCSLCWTPALAMQRSSPSRQPISSSLVSTQKKPQNTSSGVRIPVTLSKTSQLLAYLEIISTVQCQSEEIGIPTQKQSALLIHRVEEQMKQQQLISPNETVSCTCTKCELTETGIVITLF